jgi:hypothetical protein
MLLFVEFLLPKLFDAIQAVSNSTSIVLQDQQMTLQTQLMNLAAENK